MPKKSGQDRRKKLSRSKRKELRSPGTVQQRPVAQTPAAAASPKISPPLAAVSSTKTTQVAIQHRYVMGDLKRIGILGGIMLVILVVLAVALS